MSERTSRHTENSGANRAFDWLIFGVVVTAALIIAAAKYTGCRVVPARSAPANSLQVDIESSPGVLDPRLEHTAVSARIGELAYAALVKVDPHGDFVGELAHSFERPTPTTIVFHLRPGLRFSDGRPLGARDVKYTYDSILDPANHSPLRAQLKVLTSIAAPDPTTVVMTTARPYGPALDMATVGVVPDGTPLPAAGEARWPAASGPFEVVRLVHGESVVLARNPHRGHTPGAISEIVFKVVTDRTLRSLELSHGVCDLAENNIPPGLLGYLGMQPDLMVETSPGTRYFQLVFNFRNPDLRDLRVRQAVAYAIARGPIMGSLYGGKGRVASGLLSPENWAYNGDVTRYHFDPYKASHLLDEAGYAIQMNGTRKLDFVYLTTPEGKALGQAVQGMLKRVGIGLEIRSVDSAIFERDIRDGKFDLFVSQRERTRGPYQYYAMFDSEMAPPGGDNYGAYSNPSMDRLLAAANAALERGARRKIYAQVQELAARDLPTLPLWWLDNVVVLNRRVRGFVAYPDGSLRSLSRVSFAPSMDSRAH